MNKKNQLSKSHLDVFTRAGWIVQPVKENDLTDCIGEETMLHLFSYKHFTTRTINIDYARETLLIVQNDTRSKLNPHILYDAPLPETDIVLLLIFESTKIIEKQLIEKLLTA